MVMNEWMLALAGGALIGLAAVILMAVEGQIMGISGILRRVLPPQKYQWSWRFTFLAGVLLTPIVVAGFNPEMLQTSMTGTTWILVLGGLLVGAGVSVGNGCTSGHGVCGLSRLSARSIVATGVFMFTGFVTVFIVRHVIGG